MNLKHYKPILPRVEELRYTSINNFESDMYFYHTDHLGSSSWITDASGAVNQHLQYLPYGEDFVYQRNSSWAVPYTFSGKEKDTETGYSYFGARYYDSDLSVWLSVVPIAIGTLAGKYPSMSAYMYCAGNPVMLVDPDGRAPVPPDDFEKCSSFGGISFIWLKRFFKRIVWHNEVSKIHVKTSSLQVIRPRWNNGTNRNIKIRGSAQIQFETLQIEDQLIIIDRKSGRQVVNSGSVATDGTPQNYVLGRGKYKLIVRPNTNPNQNDDNTWYQVTINDQAFKTKKVIVKKLWGFIPYSRRVSHRGQWTAGTFNRTGQLKQKSNRIKGF